MFVVYLVNIALVLTNLAIIVHTGGAAHDVGVLAARLQEYKHLDIAHHKDIYDSPSQQVFL